MKRILTLLLLMLSLGTARAEPRKIVQWVENTSFPWAQIATQQGIALADDGTIWALSYNGAPPFCSLTNLESMGTYLWTAVSLVPVPSHRKIIQVFPVQWTGPDLFIWPSESIGQSGIRALMNDGTLWMLADTLPGCT